MLIQVLFLAAFASTGTGNVLDEKKVDFEMMDTDASKEFDPETLMKLKELGFNVTAVVAVCLKNDGSREDMKKLIFERESKHSFFIQHLTEAHMEVPEIITEAEVKRVIEKRVENPLSFTDENARVEPTSTVLRIEVNLDPSQDINFIFEGRGDRRKRWLRKVWRSYVTIREGFRNTRNNLRDIWGK